MNLPSLIRSCAPALVLALLALPGAGENPSSTTGNCAMGPAGGLWRLPGSTAITGLVDGVLQGPSTTSPYRFTATLLPGPVACVTCIGGRIQGYIDDGIGPGPDFAVIGTYSGQGATGQGTFYARIVGTAVTSPTGWISGAFQDSPADLAPGTFQGRWRICQ